MKPLKPFAKKLTISKETIASMAMRTNVRTGMVPATCNNACYTTGMETNNQACWKCG